MQYCTYNPDRVIFEVKGHNRVAFLGGGGEILSFVDAEGLTVINS